MDEKLDKRNMRAAELANEIKVLIQFVVFRSDEFN